MVKNMKHTAENYAQARNHPWKKPNHAKAIMTDNWTTQIITNAMLKSFSGESVRTCFTVLKRNIKLEKAIETKTEITISGATNIDSHPITTANAQVCSVNKIMLQSFVCLTCDEK